MDISFTSIYTKYIYVPISKKCHNHEAQSSRGTTRGRDQDHWQNKRHISTHKQRITATEGPYWNGQYPNLIFIVPNDYVSGQRRPLSDCKEAHNDPDLCCLHMPEAHLHISHSAAQIYIYIFAKIQNIFFLIYVYRHDCIWQIKCCFLNCLALLG